MCKFVAVFNRVLARTLVVHGEWFVIASFCSLSCNVNAALFTHSSITNARKRKTAMCAAVVGGSMDGRAAGGGVGGLRGLTVQCGSM